MADLNKLADLQSVLVTSATKTLTAADQGIVQDVAVDADITLPATAVGLVFYIRNRARLNANAPVGAVQNKGITLRVSPQAADGISGNGITPAVNKELINTKATSEVGNYVKLVGTGVTGVTAWYAEEVSGIWAREA